MKQSGTRNVLILSMVAMLALGACAGAASPNPSATAASPNPSATQAEKIIYFGWGGTPGSPDDYQIPLYMYTRDNLKAAGYDLQFLTLTSDEVVTAAIDRGRLDVGMLSMVGLQRAVHAGLRMKWVLTNETQNTFVMVVHKDVTNLSQLKGKKIGVQDPSSLTAAAVPGFLGPAGLTPADYTVVNLSGSANRAAALAAGSMDASMMLYTIATQLVAKSNGEFKVWGEGAPAGQPMTWEGFVMGDAFRATPAAAAFVKAELDGFKKFYATDPATIAKDAIALGIPELDGLDEASATADMKLYQSTKLFPVDGGVGQDLFTPMIETLVAAEQLKQGDTVPYADAVDPSVVTAAIK